MDSQVSKSFYRGTSFADDPRGSSADKKTPAQSSGMKTLREEFEQKERDVAAEESKIDDNFSLLLAKKSSEQEAPIAPVTKQKSEKKPKQESPAKLDDWGLDFADPAAPASLEIINGDLADTITGMDEATKAAVFGKLSLAVRAHLMPKKSTSLSGLFQRKLTAQSGAKLDILRAYNGTSRLDSIEKKDCVLAADLLLDLLLYKTERLIKLPSHLKKDFENYQKMDGQAYTLDLFKKRITLGDPTAPLLERPYPQMVDELFSIIAQSRTFGLTKNLTEAATNLADCLLHGDQTKHSEDMTTVVGYLLSELSEKPLDTQSAASELDAESLELSQRIQDQLSDDKRIEIAEVLKDKIESKVKAAWSKKQTCTVYTKSTAEGMDGKVLLLHAQSILTDKCIPKVDIQTMG